MIDYPFEEYLSDRLEKGNLYTLITLKIRYACHRKSMISARDIEKVLAEAKADFPVLDMMDMRNTRKYAKETQVWLQKWFSSPVANKSTKEKNR